MCAPHSAGYTCERVLRRAGHVRKSSYVADKAGVAISEAAGPINHVNQAPTVPVIRVRGTAPLPNPLTKSLAAHLEDQGYPRVPPR